MSFRTLRGRAAAALLASLFAAGCASTPAAPDHSAGQPIVPGEALIRAEAAPAPDALAKAANVSGLVITAVEPVFGKVYRVKFARAEGDSAPVDEAFTRSVVAAIAKAEGILASEPNIVEQPRPAPEKAQAAENP